MALHPQKVDSRNVYQSVLCQNRFCNASKTVSTANDTAPTCCMERRRYAEGPRRRSGCGAYGTSKVRRGTPRFHLEHEKYSHATGILVRCRDVLWHCNTMCGFLHTLLHKSPNRQIHKSPNRSYFASSAKQKNRKHNCSSSAKSRLPKRVPTVPVPPKL